MFELDELDKKAAAAFPGRLGIRPCGQEVTLGL